MEDNSPERLDKSLTRLEMTHQLSETAGLILADVNKLVAYLASVTPTAMAWSMKR